MQTTAPLHSLTFHPLVADLPGLMPEDSHEFLALVDDIAARGIDQALIVVADESGRLLVVDGRNRFRAATVADLAEVPIVMRDEAEVPGIILGTLVQRRHYGKGALAYLAYPLAATQKRAGRGGNGSNQHRKQQMSTQSTIAPISIDEIAAQLGFARDLFYKAAKVHEYFAHSPEQRARFEPRILSGEVGLGACIAGLASSEATTGSERRDRSPYQLLTDTFGELKRRFDQRWDKLEGAARLAVAEEATSTVLSLPPEVQEKIAAALGAARKSGRAA